MNRAAFFDEKRTRHAHVEVLHGRNQPFVGRVVRDGSELVDQALGLEHLDCRTEPLDHLGAPLLGHRSDQVRKVSRLHFADRDNLPATGPAPRTAGDRLAFFAHLLFGDGNDGAGEAVQHRQDIDYPHGSGRHARGGLKLAVCHLQTELHHRMTGIAHRNCPFQDMRVSYGSGDPNTSARSAILRIRAGDVFANDR